MKALSHLLQQVSVKSIQGSQDLSIQSTHFDSKEVQSQSLFLAIKGTQVDGHLYNTNAIEQGACVIVCEQLPETIIKEVTYIEVNDSAEALGIIAANFYDNPSHQLKLVAVTGTNGKTTTATLLFRLFRALGYNVGLLSTVQNQINESIIPATHTTPDAIQLNQLLTKMLQTGCTHCFMEASSHAIDMRRIAGLHFSGAIFTNISHDHLDYHKTFDNYIKAKKRLFDDLPKGAFALSNIDDRRGEIMLQNTKAQKNTYSLLNPSKFKGKLLDNTLHGLLMEIENKQIWFKLIGTFNAYNLLGVYAAAVLLGEDENEVLQHLSGLPAATGRFEQIMAPSGTIGIVDYAHTPDALENVLNTIQGLREDNQQVITLVGCGGNRDKTKRPVMAKIACKLSTKVILTSDNPRFEDPMEILNDMLAGLSPVDKKKVTVIENREKAIETACQMATEIDIILVAGKGHETYQEIQGVKYPFDDKEVLADKMNQFQNKPVI